MYKANRKVPCVYMRGGTSKAVFFHDRDLPSDPQARDRMILSAFGSPDLRQIDGMGRRQHFHQQGGGDPQKRAGRRGCGL